MPSSHSQSFFSPAFGHGAMMPFSVETPSRVGPRSVGQSEAETLLTQVNNAKASTTGLIAWPRSYDGFSRKRIKCTGQSKELGTGSDDRAATSPTIRPLPLVIRGPYPITSRW